MYNKKDITSSINDIIKVNKQVNTINTKKLVIYIILLAIFIQEKEYYFV